MISTYISYTIIFYRSIKPKKLLVHRWRLTLNVSTFLIHIPSYVQCICNLTQTIWLPQIQNSTSEIKFWVLFSESALRASGETADGHIARRNSLSLPLLWRHVPQRTIILYIDNFIMLVYNYCCNDIVAN